EVGLDQREQRGHRELEEVTHEVAAADEADDGDVAAEGGPVHDSDSAGRGGRRQSPFRRSPSIWRPRVAAGGRRARAARATAVAPSARRRAPPRPPGHVADGRGAPRRLALPTNETRRPDRWPPTDTPQATTPPRRVDAGPPGVA